MIWFRHSVARAGRVLGGLVLVSLLALVAGCGRADSATATFRGIDLTGAKYAQDFRLLDAEGRERTLADFRGKLVMVYFGFVQCPDVCPTALARAVETKQLLGSDGDKLQVVFVTVDPERDTPDMLKAYMAAFDPAFVALHGDAAQTRATADDFKVYYKKVPTGSGYTMDHTATSYLFDTQGRLRVALSHGQTAQDYAHDAALLLQQGS